MFRRGNWYRQQSCLGENGSISLRTPGLIWGEWAKLQMSDELGRHWVGDTLAVSNYLDEKEHLISNFCAYKCCVGTHILQ